MSSVPGASRAVLNLFGDSGQHRQGACRDLQAPSTLMYQVSKGHLAWGTPIGCGIY